MSEIDISVSDDKAGVESDTPSRFMLRMFMAGLLTIGTVLLSALGWGLLAYITGNTNLRVAVFVGIAVSFAITFPFKKLSDFTTLLLFVFAAVLTVVSILLGNFIFFAQNVAGEFDMTRADAAVAVLTNFNPIIPEGGWGSILFALIGTVVGFLASLGCKEESRGNLTGAQ